MIINLGLLLCVVSIPYVTSLMAEYLRNGGWDANVAAALYSGVMCGTAFTFAGLFESLGRAASRMIRPFRTRITWPLAGASRPASFPMWSV